MPRQYATRSTRAEPCPLRAGASRRKSVTYSGIWPVCTPSPCNRTTTLEPPLLCSECFRLNQHWISRNAECGSCARVQAQHGDWVVNHDKCRPDRPDYEHSFCTKKNETWVPRNKDCGEFCPYTPKEACAVLGRSRDVIIAGKPCPACKADMALCGHYATTWHLRSRIERCAASRINSVVRSPRTSCNWGSYDRGWSGACPPCPAGDSLMHPPVLQATHSCGSCTKGCPASSPSACA